MRYSSTLQEQLKEDKILICPGAHDPMSARVIDQAGFDAVYMTGYGTSLSTIGYPDAGFITMPEMISNANNIQESVDVPVIADADNGFGNATNVIRTVREYIKTGVGAIHIEDQKFPKRCGHVAGRQVIPKEEAVGKYRAAADIRDERDEDFVLIARTDARGAVGGSLEDAIDRANAYCEAGADVAFVEGPADESEVKRIGKEVDAPLLYNATGISPLIESDELQSMGFDIVIYPGLSMQATMYGLLSHVPAVKEHGVAEITRLGEEMQEIPFEGMHEFAGFPKVVEWEKKYLPEEEQEKYQDTLGAAIADED